MLVNYKIGVSALTASILGLKDISTDAISFQAYFMVGNKCTNDCAFCSQSKSSKKNSNLLSRVSWPNFPVEDVINSLIKNSIIKKACFQVVAQENYFNNFINILKIFQNKVKIPYGASIEVQDLNQIEILFDSGISNLGIALDAASENVYKMIKKNNISFYDQLNLILQGSKIYPGKITIHLIIGLGETDLDIINLFKILKNIDINIALFAFTPIKGTKMESYPNVKLERYRFIQLLREIFINNKGKRFCDIEEIFKLINFDKDNMIKSFDKNIFRYNFIEDILEKGEYLKTSGCFLCNRPYYNDKPQNEDLYNFHFTPPSLIIEKWKNFFRKL